MAYIYADQATRTLTKAVPTVDSNGKVINWELEFEFELNGYRSKLQAYIDLQPSKTPGAFSKDELLTFPEVAHLSAVYNSQYESTQIATFAPAETRLDGFDVDLLK